MKAIFLGLILFSTATFALQKTVTVGNIQPIGLPGEKADVVKTLVRGEIQNTEGYRVVDGGEYKITGSITKLDESYILLIGLDSEKENRSRQVKLKSFDEIDTAVHRVLQALLHNRGVEETATRGEILSRDSTVNERVKSIKGWEFAFGLGFPMKSAFNDGGQMWAFNLGYAWDVRSIFVELRWDLLQRFNSDHTGVMSFTLGAQYIWLDAGNVAVFSGAEFGYGTTLEASNYNGAFDFSGDIGLLLLRQADVNLDVRFRVSTLTKSLSNGLPVLGSFLVGLHF